MSWAGRRRAQYASLTILFLSILVGGVGYLVLYEEPSCFDGRLNQDEIEEDCGGVCARLCPFQATDPVIRFSRAFEVTPGYLSALAYVDNPNPGAGVRNAPYLFSFYDENNVFLGERRGSVAIAPRGVTPIFEPELFFDGIVPARTFFEFDGALVWERAVSNENYFEVKNRVLRNEEVAPRIDAILENTSIEDVRDVDAVVTVFNTRGNAIAASRTVVEYLPAQSEVPLVFTWPAPFPKEQEACAIPVDVMLLVDVSGSMNDDGGDPPQPLSAAKAAAASFVDRLATDDRVGVVSFATNARVEEPVTTLHGNARRTLLSLSILPAEETGFTNSGDALEKVGAALIGLATEDRKRVIVLLTDGLSNAPEPPGGEAYALDKAATVKREGILLYTIGLGDRVNDAFLKELASSEEGYYQAAASGDLDAIYRQVSAAICERGPAVIEIIPKTTHDVFERRED